MHDLNWITLRDMKVLKLLYYCRFQTTNQIANIHYKYDENGEMNKYYKTIARRRLKKMREEGLIKSYHRANNSTMVHTLYADGLYLVASLLGCAFNDLYYNYKDDLMSYSKAEHSIMLSDVYIDLLEAAERLGGKIELFQVEELNRKVYKMDGEEYIFIPDIFLIYRPNKSKDIVRLFFIEVDNSTERPKVFIDSKIPKYEMYYHTGEFQELYEGLFPEVVTLCKDQKRIDKLKARTDTILGWNYYLYEDIERMIK